jgi:indole-3-glycerol phosphate synthase
VLIIDTLVELLMADELEADDIEDCLDDYMELGYNVLVEAQDHKEIGETLIKIRSELTERAKLDLDMT